MTALLLALLTQTQGTATTQVPMIYVPDARFKMVYPVQLHPVALTEAMKKSKIARQGGTIHMEWSVEVVAGHCILHYSKFTDAAPAKLTTKQNAEWMYEASLDLAKSMMSINKEGDWMQMHEKKFTNRTVTERKIGSFDGYVDAHEDTLAKTFRRMISWGDNKEQWMLELSLDNTGESMKAILDRMVDSVGEAKLTPAQVKDLPDHEQKLPGTGVKISAPGIFGIYKRPNVDSARPTKEGLTANLNLTSGYSITVISDRYGDEIKSDTAKTADKLLAATPDVKASKVQPFSLGSWSGQTLRMDLTDAGAPAYMISAILTRPGTDLIVHIQVSKELGGKEKAESILATLKEDEG